MGIADQNSFLSFLGASGNRRQELPPLLLPPPPCQDGLPRCRMKKVGERCLAGQGFYGCQVGFISWSEVGLALKLVSIAQSRLRDAERNTMMRSRRLRGTAKNKKTTTKPSRWRKITRSKTMKNINLTIACGLEKKSGKGGGGGHHERAANTRTHLVRLC